jgi:hypothetical protein
MSSNEDVIASVVESQNDGQLDAEVGQDEGTNNEESSTTDWEAQAKYMQSEKDKLYAENQQMRTKVQEYLDSRKSEQPVAPEQIVLKPDEFDPWEAYNDPTSASFKSRVQNEDARSAKLIEQAVGGLKAEQGRTSLRTDLANHGLTVEEQDSFFEFADKHPSEYGLENVIKMFRAVSQSPNTQAENPLDQIRQNQANPTSAGVLQGQQPERKSADEQMYEDVMNADGFGNKLP